MQQDIGNEGLRFNIKITFKFYSLVPLCNIGEAIMTIYGCVPKYHSLYCLKFVCTTVKVKIGLSQNLTPILSVLWVW